RAHYRLESVDNGRGLLGVGTRPYTEINVGLRHSELLEEHLGHGGVVMLSGVNQRLTYGRMRPKRTQNRGGFHGAGARADEVENVHGGQPRLYTVGQVKIRRWWFVVRRSNPKSGGHFLERGPVKAWAKSASGGDCYPACAVIRGRSCSGKAIT